MSLEIPNAIAAALSFRFNNTLPTGQKYEVRSSNGIAEKLSELDAMVQFAGFSLEQPCSPDECAVQVNSSVQSIGGTNFFSAFMMPTADGFPGPDTFPDNTLVIGCVVDSLQPTNSSCVVFRIPRG